ncbi:GYD domain-containing protein [Yinghuangia seranimata]|uniref:GYD domain-containing protein n=1 Tax=Yinghuangia seranimata TaxID=408067 RepID=UPI00248AE0F2|nr:GYD domain-containing protein [Yinghuangia seranimata]MDI2125024.1 GYD domain-containing protein [Yinghuangia seranimata]
MPVYITLLNWTEQGIRAYKDSPARAQAFAGALTKAGGSLVDVYWTVGPYDLVCIVEASDDESLVAALLEVGALGNVRSTTMRAFATDDMERIIAKNAG